jgi:hypothetical protein
LLDVEEVRGPQDGVGLVMFLAVLVRHGLGNGPGIDDEGAALAFADVAAGFLGLLERDSGRRAIAAGRAGTP